MSSNRYWLVVISVVLLLVCCCVFYLDFRLSSRGFTFAMLDVGQGDALFIESPTGTQILIDAGAPRKILGELIRVMPAFDRSLDAIIFTHPDQDHIGGFLDVLQNYKVGMAFEPGSFNDSRTYLNLKNQLAEKGIPVQLLQRSMVLHLGDGAKLTILFPDRDVSAWVTNDASVVAILSYREYSFLLTGDATVATEDIVLSYGDVLTSEVLKVGHHGSKTSTSPEFIEEVAPEYALISVGKDNNYGHPHREVLDILENFGTSVLRTDEKGTVVFKTNGEDLDISFRK